MLIIIDKEPFLTFAIPTYNRQEQLKECLDSIVKEIKKSWESIEIFVSDNCSDDLTPNILTEYSAKYDFIRYQRNEKNLGVDMNIIISIKNSKGRYVWVFSDDDIVNEGALNNIIEKIKGYEPDYISPDSYQFVTKDGKKIITNEKVNKGIKQDYRSINLERLLWFKRVEIGFISCVILKRDMVILDELWLEIRNYENFIQLELTAQALSKWNGLITPIIAVGHRMDNARKSAFSADLKAWYKIFTIVFPYYFKKYSINKRVQRHTYSLWNNIFLFALVKMCGIVKDGNGIDRNVPMRSLDILILKIPSPWILFLYRIYHIIKYKRKFLNCF